MALIILFLLLISSYWRILVYNFELLHCGRACPRRFLTRPKKKNIRRRFITTRKHIGYKNNINYRTQCQLRHDACSYQRHTHQHAIKNVFLHNRARHPPLPLSGSFLFINPFHIQTGSYINPATKYISVYRTKVMGYAMLHPSYTLSPVGWVKL